jgi:hypothetical protein
MGRQSEALKLAIKDELIGEFRLIGARTGTLIPKAWLYDDFLPSLSAKEEAALEETVAEMIEEGLIEYVPGPQPTYQLTKQGAAMIC